MTTAEESAAKERLLTLMAKAANQYRDAISKSDNDALWHANHSHPEGSVPGLMGLITKGLKDLGYLAN